jgi:hypothetical protein
MSKFTSDLRKRLQSDVASVRDVVDEILQIDNVVDPQREVLKNAIEEIIRATDDLLGVSSILDVAQGKRSEARDGLEAAINRFADTATLASNLDTMNTQPTEIKSTLQNAPKTNAKIAIKLLDDDTRRKWLEWLQE